MVALILFSATVFEGALAAGPLQVSPTYHYLTVFVLAMLVAMVIGSSATVAGMIGVAFVGLATITGSSPGITAGAVVSGAAIG